MSRRSEIEKQQVWDRLKTGLPKKVDSIDYTHSVEDIIAQFVDVNMSAEIDKKILMELFEKASKS